MNGSYLSVVPAAVAVGLLLVEPCAGAGEVVFQADFQAATPGLAGDGPGFETLMNSGTATGTWTSINFVQNASEGPAVRNDGGTEQAAVIGVGLYEYAANLASTVSLSNTVTISMDVAKANGHNDTTRDRDNHIVGFTSSGEEIFRILVEGINQVPTLAYLQADDTNVTIGGIVDYNNEVTYSPGVMTNFRLELSATGFDVYHAGGETPVASGIPYRTGGVSDLAEIRFIGVEGRADFWLDNLVVTNEGVGSLPFQFEIEASGSDLVFTWDSQPGKVYDLLSSTDPDGDGSPETWAEVAGQQDIPSTPDTNTRTIARPGDATRFYAIREENAPPPPPAFFDDFESVPNPDWTVGANGGDAGTTVWERGAPINVGPTSGYDGSATCFGTNISADYTLGTDIWLRTPPIDLTGEGITGATLSFFQHRDTDLDGEVDDDYGTIRVLDANSLAQLGGDIANDVEGFDFDVGNNPIWVEFEAVALPAEAIGKEVVIEFRFKSDDLAATFAGWYIDNVKVEVN